MGHDDWPLGFLSNSHMENSLQVPTEIPHNIPHILHDLPVLDPVGKKPLVVH